MKNAVNYLFIGILFCFCYFPLSAQKISAGTNQYNHTSGSGIAILQKSDTLPDTALRNALSSLGQERYQFNPTHR